MLGRRTRDGEQEPEVEEITKIIMSSMSSNKSPGENRVSAEILKKGRKEIESRIVDLTQNIWKK